MAQLNTGAKHSDWLRAEELATITPEILKARMVELKPLVAAHAREAEQLRRPSDTVWQALRKSGIFYHFVPKKFGGLQFGLDSFIDCMLPIGEVCASTCWVATFCMEHNWQLALFPPDTQAKIFKQFPYIIAPGVTVPPGRAKAVEGGYRLSGRWRFASGIMHADWVLATGIVEGATPPTMLGFIIPAAEVAIHDVWHVDGMAGTGSNDFEAQDVFVPAENVLDFASARAGQAPGALYHDTSLYKMPMTSFLALTASIAAVGAAKGAVANFKEYLQTRAVFGAPGTHAERPAAQMRLAQADIQSRTAERLLRASGKDIMTLADQDGGSVADRLALRMQIAFAVNLAKQAVATICEAAGSSAHYLDNPLQRAVRDVNVIATHVVFDFDAVSEQHGRAMIGLPPTTLLV